MPTRLSLSLTRCGTGRSAPASSQEYRADSRTMRRCSPPRSSSSSSSSVGSISATLADAYCPPCIARYAKRVALALGRAPLLTSFVGSVLACHCDRGTTAPDGENGLGCIETLVLIPSMDQIFMSLDLNGGHTRPSSYDEFTCDAAITLDVMNLVGTLRLSVMDDV